MHLWAPWRLGDGALQVHEHALVQGVRRPMALQQRLNRHIWRSPALNDILMSTAVSKSGQAPGLRRLQVLQQATEPTP